MNIPGGDAPAELGVAHAPEAVAHRSRDEEVADGRDGLGHDHGPVLCRVQVRVPLLELVAARNEDDVRRDAQRGQPHAREEDVGAPGERADAVAEEDLRASREG